MNYYKILGVDRGAESDVIDAAYRAMMRRYHPDRYTGPMAEAERRSKLLNEAYAALKDPDKRRRYDETLGPIVPPVRPIVDALPNPDRPTTRLRYRLGLLGAAAVGVIVLIYAMTRPPATRVATPPPVAASPQRRSKAIPIPTATPASESADCRGARCAVMTPFGWAGVEAGVTTDSAEHASGMRLRDDGHYTDIGDGSCLSYRVVGGPENLRMLVENGVVTTIEAYLDPKQPVFRTDRGVRLGDPEAAVRAAYKDLKQLPDIYSEPPDKKLLHYERGGVRGLKFDINGGKVSGISVGTRSIEYVEGCL